MRDLRDPQLLGARYLFYRKEGTPIAQAVELSVPNYDLNETMQTVATKEYREDLERRMKNDDRYAAQRYKDLFGGD